MLHKFKHLTLQPFATFNFELINPYKGTTLDNWSVWVISTQPPTSATCGWSTFMCRTSECFTQVVSHTLFAQELTSPMMSLGLQRRYLEKPACAQQLLCSHPVPGISRCLSLPLREMLYFASAVNILLS